MSPLSLLPWVGSATTLARGAAQALGESLSFAATLGRFSDADSKVADAEESVPLAERERAFHLAADRFRQLLQERLHVAGIDLQEPLELQSDGLGGIQVAGDHPDRRLIEQLLSGDAELQKHFQALADDYSQVHPELDLRHDPFGLQIAGNQSHVAVEN